MRSLSPKCSLTAGKPGSAAGCLAPWSGMMTASMTVPTSGSEASASRAATASAGRLNVGIPTVTRGSAAGSWSPGFRWVSAAVSASRTTAGDCRTCPSAGWVADQPAERTGVSDSQVRSYQNQPRSSKAATEAVNSAVPSRSSCKSTSLRGPAAIFVYVDVGAGDGDAGAVDLGAVDVRAGLAGQLDAQLNLVQLGPAAPVGGGEGVEVCLEGDLRAGRDAALGAGERGDA